MSDELVQLQLDNLAQSIKSLSEGVERLHKWAADQDQRDAAIVASNHAIAQAVHDTPSSSVPMAKLRRRLSDPSPSSVERELLHEAQRTREAVEVLLGVVTLVAAAYVIVTWPRFLSELGE